MHSQKISKTRKTPANNYMSFKSLQSFFVTHRQLIFIILGALCIFLIFSPDALAQRPGDEAAEAAAAAEADLPPVVKSESNWLADVIAKFIFSVALGIGGLFTGIGGILLDLAVNETILKAGEYLKSTSLQSFGGGIVQLWQMVRDIFNILFIFSLVYLGIRTILKSDDTETQRKLGYIIIAALLINFSLYITQ